MHASQVTFRNAEVPITNLQSGEEPKKMEIIEIRFPDGKVSAFPADAVSPETGRKYRDIYSGKYNAFKNGDPDPDRVARLEREIEERQAELDGLRGKPQDDERLQENLGYGDMTGKNEAKAAADVAPRGEPRGTTFAPRRDEAMPLGIEPTPEPAPEPVLAPAEPKPLQEKPN